MTQEKKCFVSPDDISAVRFRCVKCQAASIVPIGKLQKGGRIVDEMSRDCPYCHAASGFNAKTQVFAEFVDFNLLLGKLSGILKGTNIDFSLQVECTE
jgi:hypothetical protein